MDDVRWAWPNNLQVISASAKGLPLFDDEHCIIVSSTWQSEV